MCTNGFEHARQLRVCHPKRSEGCRLPASEPQTSLCDITLFVRSLACDRFQDPPNVFQQDLVAGGVGMNAIGQI